MKIKYEEKVKNLEDVKKIQCNDGNWNHDPYMHGLANGLIMALAIMQEKDPEFLKAPKKWLCDKKSPKGMKEKHENLHK